MNYSKKFNSSLFTGLFLMFLSSFGLIAYAQTYRDMNFSFTNVNQVLGACRELAGSCERPAVDAYCKNNGRLAVGEGPKKLVDAYATAWEKGPRRSDNTRELISIDCKLIIQESS